MSTEDAYDAITRIMGPDKAAAVLAAVTASVKAQDHLTRRFGNDDERRRADDLNAPRVPHLKLLHYVNLAALFPGKFDRPAPTRQDWLAALRMIEPAREDLETVERDTLNRARQAGLTWREIAAALGLQGHPRGLPLRPA